MIGIVDYGMGNLASIRNMLKKIGVPSFISSNRKELESAEKIILPGVGAFDNAIDNIHKLGLRELLNEKVLQEKVPTLGICLGMQILLERSDEGSRKGLGWVEGEVKKFNFDQSPGLKIPHMGWNLTRAVDQNSLFKNLEQPRFYFVHSFYVKCENQDNILATTTYGVEFVSAIRRQNIFGTQFHPEKSHKYGMQLLRNFVATT
jgi:imidazole glycerol-phosphate synthase subunit HisH